MEVEFGSLMVDNLKSGIQSVAQKQCLCGLDFVQKDKCPRGFSIKA